MQPTSSSISSDQPPQQQSKPPTPQLSQQRGISPSPILPASQQHWMPMQYPPAAMIMPPQMMPPHYLPPPPHYMAAAYPHPFMQPPPQPLHHGASGHHNHRNNNGNNGFNGDVSSGENKTIWLGDLHHWMDEQYLHSCFASSYEIANIKVIRNRKTGISEKYGFVEFNTHAMAEKALQSYAGAMMPNTDQHFRMNWASFSAVDKRADTGSDHSIFVGDLAADVTDNLLLETFANKYPSVKAAKVVVDVSTGRSKGYGFVRFGDDNERTQAMTEMNGVYCSTRPMRTGAATPRKSMGYQQGSPQLALVKTMIDTYQKKLLISLEPESLLYRSNAEEALEKLNGTAIGSQTVRLSWGRNPTNKQMRNGYGNQWNAGYYGGPVYDYYPVPHPYDPSMYAAAYGAYPMYGNQQQVS
ncbi:hypothetical protein V2J09_017094 [Rumex salicifolius]